MASLTPFPVERIKSLKLGNAAAVCSTFRSRTGLCEPGATASVRSADAEGTEDTGRLAGKEATARPVAAASGVAAVCRRPDGAGAVTVAPAAATEEPEAPELAAESAIRVRCELTEEALCTRCSL